MKLTDSIEVLNCDCMEYMRSLPDKAFELAICDPPYGIDRDGHTHDISNNGTQQWKGYEFKNLDRESPSEDYFKELFRVSKNQIIWGGNYFTKHLPASMGWIFWYKMQEGLTMSDGELAFSSFDRALRAIPIHRTHLWMESPIHPTQKPIKLYRWLLTHYAKPGDRILDTHFGSLSSGIACHTEGFEYVGCEIDVDYYTAALKRFREVTAQKRLFA